MTSIIIKYNVVDIVHRESKQEEQKSKHDNVTKILSIATQDAWHSNGTIFLVLELSVACKITKIVLRNAGSGFIRVMKMHSKTEQKQQQLDDLYSLLPCTQLCSIEQARGLVAIKKPQRQFKHFSNNNNNNNEKNYKYIVIKLEPFIDGPSQVGLGFLQLYGTK